MKKLNTYFQYLIEYLRYGDIISVFDSVSYLVWQRPSGNDRLVKGRTGWFFCRKDTNDFKFANYTCQQGFKDFILRQKHHFDVFIDIGSGIGNNIIFLAKKQTRCYAFEPVTSNYHSLLKNIKLNNLNSLVQTYPYGLGCNIREASFIFSPIDTSASRLAINAEEANCTVKIRNLDSLIRKLEISKDDHVLIKLNAENMEDEVVRGARRFIASAPNLTLVMKLQPNVYESVIKTLDDLGQFEYGMVDEENLFAAKLN
ncbi:MAG TPA: FkbM family methyltransferase [Bacteroidales bacterium]